MPFPKVFGIPSETSEIQLRQMRSDIILMLSEATGVSASIIRPFFLQDMLEDPDDGQDDTIYCELDTSMFVGMPEHSRQRATSAIAEVIWQAFSGEFEVEVFIGDLDGTGKTLRKPALETFAFDEVEQDVVYTETLEVVPGVMVDVYDFIRDDEKDLAIVQVQPGSKTPLQRVVSGIKTIEGYVSGKGKLTITPEHGESKTFTFSETEFDLLFTYAVKHGDVMQWEASDDSILVFSEVCFPPYEDGRFENID